MHLIPSKGKNKIKQKEEAIDPHDSHTNKYVRTDRNYILRTNNEPLPLWNVCVCTYNICLCVCVYVPYPVPHCPNMAD